MTKALLLMTIYLTGCYSREPEKTNLEGKTLPSFQLILSDSSTYFNTSQIPKGKPFVLFYYGPYCPYSRAQMEEIIEDMNILKNIHFYVITSWPFKDMKAFSNNYSLDKFSNITPGMDYKNFFVDYFEIQGVPYTAIYDKDKKLKQAFIGKVYGKQIKQVAEE